VSVRMIQVENSWMDLGEIWYERCAIGVYLKIVIFIFLQSVIPTWGKNKLVRWEFH